MSGIRAVSSRPDAALTDSCPRCSGYALLADILRGMQWKVHSEQSIYRDPLIDICRADVELPDGRRLDHRVIRTAPSAGALVLNDKREALLLWRHRFITGSWGYELPIGPVHPGEDPMTAAARVLEQETGRRPGPLQPLLFLEPANDLMDAHRYIYVAQSSARRATPQVQHADWVALARVTALITSRQIVCGTTVATLLLAQAPGR